MITLKKNLDKLFCRYFHVFVVTVLLFGGNSFSAIAKSNSNELVSIQNNGSEGLSITLQTPSLNIQPVELNGQRYNKLETMTDGSAGEPGSPAIPTFSRWIEIPIGKNPVISFTTGSERVINDISISPFPHLSEDNPYVDESASQLLVSEPADFFYPDRIATVSEPMLIGTKYMALVDMFPYQYNSAQKQLRIYDSVQISVEYIANHDQDNDLTRRSAPVYRELDMAISEKPPERDDFAARQDFLGHYVIVVNNEDIIEIIEPLAEWKRKKGYIVTIANMEDIGNRRADIEAYLQDAWDEWAIPPNFVLLAGDQDGDLSIPCFREQPQFSYNASDNQYVNWRNGGPYGSWIPEGFVGRLPAAEERHLETMVAKLVGYESDPFIEESWVEGGVLIANGVQSCISTNIAVRELMVNYGYSRNRITETYADWHQGGRPNIGDIQGGIDDGVGFINFRGYNDWGNYTQGNINSLENGWMLPLVTGMVCGTNDFTNQWENECRAETFLRAWDDNLPAGGISCYGPTDLYTHTWFNNIMDAEYYNVMFNKNVRTLGVMCVASKMALLRNLPSYRERGDGHTTGYYFFTYNLMGDPGMQVWTRDPMAIELEFEAEVPFGSSLIHAVVSAEDEDQELPPVYVHIYAAGEDGEIRYGGYTDENGEISLNVQSLPVGEYFLTLTGDNIVPIMESFEVIRLSVFTSITDVTYSDDNDGESSGNGDGDLNSGETVEISISLTNTGTQASEEFSGILSTTSPYVEIERDEADWDALEAGESATNARAFIANLAPETPNNTKIQFTLITEHGDNEMEGGFEQSVLGYKFSLRRPTFVGEDVELVPASEEQLVVRVVNRGTFDTNELIAVLHCNDPKIQIRRAETVLGEIAVGEEDSNEQTPFIIFAAPDMYPNSDVSFGLLVSDETGRQDSLEFEITLGGSPDDAPQGPTKYGYWAFDLRDTTGNMNSEYEWVDGSTNLNLRDQNDAAGFSGVGGDYTDVDLPFEFTYFGERYSKITVGSNGWLCFGESEHVGWNNQEIGSGLAPPSMLAPFWTDLWSGRVFVLNDAENGRFIIEWRDFSGSGRPSPPTFAVHLYTRDARPTITGDCEFEFVYKAERRNRAPGRDLEQEDVTIGFGSPDREDRMTMTHANRWDPSAVGLLDDLDDGMTVRITTGLLSEMGGVRGNVTAVEDGEPMENVRVMLDGTGFFDNTDVDGNFHIERAPVGNYSVIAQKIYFNNDVEADIQIVEDEVAEVDFQMTYPTFNIDREEIRITVPPGESDSTGFDVWNEGNGPLNYHFNINYQVDQPEERDTRWDMMFDLAVGDSVGDTYLLGVTFSEDLFYITGQLERRQLPHKIYKLDRSGNYVGNIDQHTVDSTTTRGYFEIEMKGENLLAVEEGNFIELTTDGEAIDTIPSPYDPNQCLAWSPERGTIFSKSKVGREVVEVDLEGNVVNSFRIDGDPIRSYGMSWFPEDEDGFNLYIFGNYGPAVDNSRLLLYKMSPETGEFRMIKVFHFEGINEDMKPYGCTITKEYNPLIWTFVGLINITPFDRLMGWELGPNLSWISYEPESGQVPSGETQPFKLNFYTEGMPEEEFHVILELYHNAVGNMQEIPIFFNIGVVSAPEEEIPIANEFRLDSVFPNPFNPTTTISYHLPESADVTIGIYSVDGREIETYEQGKLSAGAKHFLFDGTDFSSGIYFINVTADEHTATKKLVLMR